MLDKLARHPRTLFLIDGLGALLTAVLLFALLGTFDEYFGMPRGPLLFLSAIALAFCAYSMCCFFFIGRSWQPFLLIISIANLLYCLLTSCLVVYYYSQLTGLGLAYFIVEMVIVCGLALVEMYVGRTGARSDGERRFPA